jgi:hypothetical protein
MNNLYDVLEICLQELENGADLEVVLARYPDLINELRPILKASVMARTMAVPAPMPEVVRRGRSKLLQYASELREQKVAPRKRMIPLFQRLAISFSLAAIFLASGTGLVGASSTALPGEHLYPVKRTWEDVRLFFVFDQQAHNALKNEFENERLQEVSNLLVEGRDETIQFAGVFMQVKGVKYISGVAVLVPANLQAPANGAAVTVTGKTNAHGFVEVESIELLPEGAVVPVGKPVEEDNTSGSSSGTGSGSEDGANSNSGSGPGSENGAGSGSGNEAQSGNANELPKSDPQSFEIKGSVKSTSNNLLVVNGQTVHLDNAKIDGALKDGVNVEIKGFYAADGSFNATEVKVKDSGSGGSGNNENQGSGSSSGSNSNDNSGSKPKDSGSGSGGDNNSGSGGSSDGGSGGGGGGDSGGGDG